LLNPHERLAILYEVVIPAEPFVLALTRVKVNTAPDLTAPLQPPPARRGKHPEVPAPLLARRILRA